MGRFTANSVCFLVAATLLILLGTLSLYERMQTHDTSGLLPHPRRASDGVGMHSAPSDADDIMQLFAQAESNSYFTPDVYIEDNFIGRRLANVSQPPWLRRFSGHPMLATSLLDGLQRATVGNPGGIAFVTMVNAAWMDMLDHMLYTAVKFGGIRSFLVVALDEEGVEACLTHLNIKMPCLDGSKYVGELTPNSEKLLNSDEYVRVTWARPKMIAEMLLYDIPVVNVDSDIVFLRPITPLISSGCSTHALFSCTCELGYCNMGFYLIRPDARSRAFWEAYVQLEDEYFNDQEMYQRVEHLLPDVGKCCLDVRLFGNSCNDPYSMIPDTEAIMWHAICMTGLQVKHDYFSSKGAWFLPDNQTERAMMLKSLLPR